MRDDDDEPLTLLEFPPKYKAFGPTYPKPTAKSKAKLTFQNACRATGRALHKVGSRTKQFKFTDLPAELRIRIYNYSLIHGPTMEINCTLPTIKKLPIIDQIRIRTLRYHYRKSLALGLLRTCRTIHLEASPIFYGKNHFECNYSDSWTNFENWLTQIGNNALYLTRVHLYWPSPTWSSLRSYNPSPRLFVFLAPIIRRDSEAYTYAKSAEQLDNDAFQRTCKDLAEKKKLGAIRLWSWRGQAKQGFNTITFFRAVILPAKTGPVAIADLKIPSDPLVMEKESQPVRHWAIQIERYRCFLKGSSIRESTEVVNYYVPGAISTPVPPTTR